MHNLEESDSIQQFLTAYGETGQLHAAAKAAGINLAEHYQLLETSELYRQRFAIARTKVGDMLESEAIRRALAGSDKLLVVLLRAWLPEQYRERVELTLSEPEAAPAREALARIVAARRERVQ